MWARIKEAGKRESLKTGVGITDGGRKEEDPEHRELCPEEEEPFL